MSPNRKQYLSIFAHCDLYHFKINWVVSDKKGAILHEGSLFSEEPSFLAMGYRLNFHWIDDEHFYCSVRLQRADFRYLGS